MHRRKVVFATNIAETGITIEGIRFVVDAGMIFLFVTSIFYCCFSPIIFILQGLVKLNYFDARSGMDSLICTHASKASYAQRAGRAGRTQPGKCFRLMTEESFRDLIPANLLPEMQRSDISWAVLQLKALGIDNVLRFDFISPPSADMMIYALELLYSLGALDNDGDLTEDGEKMADMPIEPRLARCLLSSIDMGCSDELLSIAAMCSIDNPFIKQRSTASKESKKRLQECMETFVSYKGDHLTLLNIYEGYASANFERSWCDQYCIQSRLMQRAREMRRNLERLLARVLGEGMIFASCQEDFECVQRCLVTGYFSNAAQLSPDGSYRTIRGRCRVGVHQTSIYHRFGTLPEWIIFHELVHIKESTARDITKVDPRWFLELASHYYGLSEAGQGAAVDDTDTSLHKNIGSQSHTTTTAPFVL